MFQLYQDAMTIVRKFGKPDLLITFTCNPLWDDITSNLKHRDLLNDILNRHILGRPLADVYTIEFQKRGLMSIY